MNHQPVHAHDSAELQKSVRRTTFTADIMVPALWRAVIKLDPRWMIRNPVMFVVEVGALLTLLLTIDLRPGSREPRLQRHRHCHPHSHRALRELRGSRR
jgi:hypothetical protein